MPHRVVLDYRSVEGWRYLRLLLRIKQRMRSRPAGDKDYENDGPIPPPTRRAPAGLASVFTFSLSLLPCKSIYLVSVPRDHLRLLNPGIVMCHRILRLAPDIPHLTSTIPTRRLPREAVAPGIIWKNWRIFSRARRAFLSSEADYRWIYKKRVAPSMR